MRTAVLASLPTLARVAWRSGRWEATPIVESGSPAPRPTASSVPTKAPASPTMEVRPPPGKGKGRSWRRSHATSTTWAPSRSERMSRSTPSRSARMTRCEKRPPHRAAGTMRRPGHGGSAAARDPSWGSRPPSARRRRSQGAE
jgi:hypothetical protein